MAIILTAFTLFHIAVALACIASAVRLLSANERAQWTSAAARFSAEFLVWIYPVAAFVSVKSAWRAFAAGDHAAMPLMLAPIGWLIVMGVVYAIVDYAEDGVIGNARKP